MRHHRYFTHTHHPNIRIVFVGNLPPQQHSPRNYIPPRNTTCVPCYAYASPAVWVSNGFRALLSHLNTPQATCLYPNPCKRLLDPLKRLQIDSRVLGYSPNRTRFKTITNFRKVPYALFPRWQLSPPPPSRPRNEQYCTYIQYFRDRSCTI